MSKLLSAGRLHVLLVTYFPEAKLVPAEDDSVDDEIEINEHVQVQVGDCYVTVNWNDGENYYFGYEYDPLIENLPAIVADIITTVTTAANAICSKEKNDA